MPYYQLTEEIQLTLNGKVSRDLLALEAAMHAMPCSRWVAGSVLLERCGPCAELTSSLEPPNLSVHGMQLDTYGKHMSFKDLNQMMEPQGWPWSGSSP